MPHENVITLLTTHITLDGARFDRHNASLSEDGVLAVVVRRFHEKPHGTQDDTAFPRLMRHAVARLRLARPLARRAARGGLLGGGSDPPFCPRWCGILAGLFITSFITLVWGVAPSTVIPAGRLK